MFKKSLLSFLFVGIVFSADQPEAAEAKVVKAAYGAVGSSKVGVGIGLGGFSTISSKVASTAAYGLFADNVYGVVNPFSNAIVKSTNGYSAFSVKNRSIWNVNLELNFAYMLTPIAFVRVAVACDFMNKSLKFKAPTKECYPDIPSSGLTSVDILDESSHGAELTRFTEEAIAKYPEWASTTTLGGAVDTKCLKYVEGGSSIVKLRTRFIPRVEFGYFVTRDFAVALALGFVMHNFKLNYDVNASGRQIGSGKSKTAFGYMFRLTGEYFFRDFSMAAFVDYSRATKKTDGVKNKFGGVAYGLQVRAAF